MIDPMLNTLLVQSDGKAYQITMKEAIFVPTAPEAQTIEDSTKVIFLGDFASHGVQVQAWHYINANSGFVKEATAAFMNKLSMEIALQPLLNDGTPSIRGLFVRETNKELMAKVAMKRVDIPIPNEYRHVLFIPCSTPDPIAYHFLVNIDSNQILFLPFGNTHNDSALCMGSTTKSLLRQSHGVLTKILNGVYAFHQAPWNADLYSDNKFCDSLFRFDANGNWNGEWKTDLLRGVSNATYNNAMKDILTSQGFQQVKKNKLLMDVNIKRREIHEESI